MNMRKTAAKRTTAQGAKAFPAEAGCFFEEVKERDLAALRKQNDDQFAGDEWELVDGIDFPYSRCA